MAPDAGSSIALSATFKSAIQRHAVEMTRAFSARYLALHGSSPRRAPYERRAFGAKQIPKRSWKARPRPIGLRYGEDKCVPKLEFGNEESRKRSGELARAGFRFGS
jgi:hypothetical protein